MNLTSQTKLMSQTNLMNLTSQTKLWYIISIAIFVGVGHIVGVQNFEPLPPKIEFGEAEFDFGEINQNTEATHIFKFKNIGDDTLVIKNVRAP